MPPRPGFRELNAVKRREAAIHPLGGAKGAPLLIDCPVGQFPNLAAGDASEDQAAKGLNVSTERETAVVHQPHERHCSGAIQ